MINQCLIGNFQQYFGIWYQIERNHSFPGLGGKCWTQTYYPDAHVAGKSKLRMEYHDFLLVIHQINSNSTLN